MVYPYMNYYKNLFSLTLFSLSVLYTFSQQKEVKRERLPMDHDWRFAFGHPYDAKEDFGTGTAYFSYLAKAGSGDGAAA